MEVKQFKLTTNFLTGHCSVNYYLNWAQGKPCGHHNLHSTLPTSYIPVACLSVDTDRRKPKV